MTKTSSPKRTTSAFVLFFFLTLTVSCAQQKTPEVYSPHPQAQVLSAASEPLKLVSAWLSNATDEKPSELFIEYQDRGNPQHSISASRNRNNVSVHKDWHPVYQLFKFPKSEYQKQRAGAEKIPSLNAAFWADFTEHILKQSLPKENNHAVLLNVSDKELLLYRDAQGETHLLDSIMDKPADAVLERSLRIENKSQNLFQSLRAFLKIRNITESFILVETGEFGPGARPFVLLDTEKEIFHFFSLEPFTIGSMPKEPAVTTTKVGWHFVRSYFFDAFNRPVSYFSRLVFFITDTVTDGVRGAYLSLFAYSDSPQILAVEDSATMDLVEWESYLDKKYQDTRTSGDIQLLIGGDQFFPEFISAIQSAKHSVDIRSYIFDRDDFAIAMADLLKDRSENISVRVMVDGLGTLMAQESASGTMPSDYKAPQGITSYIKKGSKVKVRSLTNPWFTGDHTKTSIIDHDTAFIGGMNIGREYRWEWHDAMMKVTGPVATFIQEDFDRPWAQSQILGDFVFAGHAIKYPRTSLNQKPQGYPIRILQTKAYDSQIYNAQIEAIKRSKKYIYVANAYFSDAKITYELTQARMRGVDVRVIIPVGGNHGIMNNNNVVAANKLLRHGVRVFAYPGMSHIKAGIYDGWACLGSANFDKLSFRVNKEMNIGVSDSGFVRELKEQLFEPDFSHSVELTEPLDEDWNHTFASMVASQL